MSILDNALTHYRDLSNQRRRIEVPEWGEDGQTAIIYAKPFTLAQEQEVERKCKGDAHERAIEVLILKCEDEAGNKLFNRADKQKMMRGIASEVVARVAKEILGAGVEIVEEEMAGN